ncbi:acyl carrier protein [Fructilactobacillus florum]|nr:acyl carrier protein [Fructilactobacillus florum]
MDEAQVFPKVANLISLDFNIQKDQVQGTTKFRQDLGADFVDLARFIVEIEDEFGDVVPNDSAEKIQTVRDLVTLIVTNTATKPKKKIKKTPSQLMGFLI